MFLIKNLKFKTAIFGLFWSKIKKTRMDSESKWKVCLMKVPLFLLKNALGPRYKSFYIFSSYPYGAILDTLPLLQFWFIFICLFTDNQPQIYLTARELFSKKNLFSIRLITQPELYIAYNIFNMSWVATACFDSKYTLHNEPSPQKLSNRRSKTSTPICLANKSTELLHL